MKKKNIQINPSYFVNTLRSCGYNNYSAIADIIDNSVNPGVNSTFVKVDFDTKGTGNPGTTVDAIYVIDNGCGMDKDTHEEAMSLGAETGQNPLFDLNKFGTGLKTASFSIGRCLEVWSKTKDDDTIHYAKVDLEPTIEKREPIMVLFEEIQNGNDIYKVFTEKVKGEHGTVVKISNLDRIGCKNYYDFKKTLKVKLAEFFNKFIYAGNFKMYVVKDEIPYVNLMGNDNLNECILDSVIEYDGHSIRVKQWKLEDAGNEDDKSEYLSNTEGGRYLSRGLITQGIYVYRNQRLVGSALTFDIFQKHSSSNAYRCEMFIDGNCDELFGSSFNKMLTNKSAETMPIELREKLANTIKPCVNSIKAKYNSGRAKMEENDPEIAKQKEEFYKKVTDKQNANMMLNVERKGLNAQKDNTVETEHTTRGPQKNPNPVKTRSNKWFEGFRELHIGPCAEMWTVDYINEKRYIIINSDHKFFKNFYSKLNTELKEIFAMYISCYEIAKENVGYNTSDEVRNIIDTYNDCYSREVNKSLTL